MSKNKNYEESFKVVREADKLYGIYKKATKIYGRIKPNEMYIIQLRGTTLLGLYQMAQTLYSIDRKATDLFQSMKEPMK